MTPVERQAVAELIQLNTDILAEKEASLSAKDEQIQSLEQQLQQVSGDNPSAQKEASQEGILDSAQIDGTVGNMIQAGWLKEAEAEDAKEAIQSDPSLVLKFIDKLASDKIEESAMPTLGHAEKTQKVASSDVRESDRMFEETFGRLSSKL